MYKPLKCEVCAEKEKLFIPNAKRHLNSFSLSHMHKSSWQMSNMHKILTTYKFTKGEGIEPNPILWSILVATGNTWAEKLGDFYAARSSR